MFNHILWNRISFLSFFLFDVYYPPPPPQGMVRFISLTKCLTIHCGKLLWESQCRYANFKKSNAFQNIPYFGELIAIFVDVFFFMKQLLVRVQNYHFDFGIIMHYSVTNDNPMDNDTRVSPYFG